MLKKVIAVLILVVFITTSTYSTAQAGWLDNWFDQHVASGPNYFEGQKRGYFTAGSFSARIPTSTDYLLSIEPPRIKAGCGGIDIFLGGIGFTDFKYLVEKLQRLIKAAPVVAFQIALNTLSSQLEGIISKVEDIINALNSLQLNECAILKPFTTINLDPSKGGSVEKQFVDAAQAALQSTGITNLYHALTAEGSKVKGLSTDPSPSDQYEGCGSELKQMIESGKSSLVAYIVSDADLQKLVRAMIGDVVIIDQNTSTPVVKVTESCSENVFQALKEGKLYKRETPLGECKVETQQSLSTKVLNILTSAYNNAKAKSQTGNTFAQYEPLAKASPIPVHLLIRYAVATGDSSVLVTASDPIAKGMLYQAYTDVFTATAKMVERLRNVASKTNNSGATDKLCNVDVELLHAAETLMERMYQGFSVISDIYYKSLGEVQKSLEVASLYKKFEEIVFSQIAGRIGKVAVERAMK